MTDTYPLSIECTDLIGTAVAAGQTVSCSYTFTQTTAGQYTHGYNCTLFYDDANSDTATALATGANYIDANANSIRVSIRLRPRISTRSTTRSHTRTPVTRLRLTS